MIDQKFASNANRLVLTLDDIKSPEKRSVISGPFGSNISSRYFTSSGIPVIRGNNLSTEIGVKFRDDGFVFVSEEKANELNSWASKDDLLFTAAGTIGQVGLLTGKEKYKKYIISNKQLRVTLDKKKVNPVFAYYWFASPAIKEIIVQRDTGSTIPLINLTVLKSLPIILPPLPEQESIAEVLSDLDEKISLLDRNNKTLEQLADTIFREWFQEDVATVPLFDFGKIVCGKTPSKGNSSFFNGSVPFLKIPDMHNKVFVTSTEDSLTKIGQNSQPNKTIPSFCINVSCIATVGLVTINAFECQTNQQINSIIPKADYYRFFLYCYLRQSQEELVLRASGGSVTHNLNTSDFSNFPVPNAPSRLIQNFSTSVSPLFEKILKNEHQIRTLEHLRDTLLPKLISGEVTVEN